VVTAVSLRRKPLSIADKSALSARLVLGAWSLGAKEAGSKTKSFPTRLSPARNRSQPVISASTV